MKQNIGQKLKPVLFEMPTYKYLRTGDIKKACEDLKATYPDANWKDGKLLNRTSKKELKTWVKGL